MAASQNRRKVLYDTDPRIAMGHAVWEADACMGIKAHCAALAMLRKAIDLWSAFYAVRHKNSSIKKGDRLVDRMRKIAAENPMYQQSISSVMTGLRLDANDAVHDPTTCAPLGARWHEIDRYKASARSELAKTLEAVAHLIKTSEPSVTFEYGPLDERPPGPPTR